MPAQNQSKQTNLAISSANFTAIMGFKDPFRFKNARRSPCREHGITKVLDVGTAIL